MVDSQYFRFLAVAWKQPHVAKLRLLTNKRLRSTLARYVGSSGVIELNPAVLARTRKVQKEIVCHEAAHAVVWRRYGKTSRPHGEEWRALIVAAGFEPRATLVRCGEQGRRRRSVLEFSHICPTCHFTRRAKRRMTRWRCPECRSIGLEGVLRIERRPATR